MDNAKQSTIKLSAVTKGRLKSIAESRGRKESYEQMILELLDNRSSYLRMVMDARNGR